MKTAVSRLNWGCGSTPATGWINSDVKDDPWVDISCDIRNGLALDDESIDYVVSIHALPELGYPDQVPALKELHRVLRTGGTLRLGLPDLDRNIEAYRSGDRSFFLIPDRDADAIGAKLITQLTWYGYSRTPFTYDFAEELLHHAGFVNVRRCAFRETASDHADIVELDDRPQESFFIEGDR